MICSYIVGGYLGHWVAKHSKPGIEHGSIHTENTFSAQSTKLIQIDQALYFNSCISNNFSGGNYMYTIF